MIDRIATELRLKVVEAVEAGVRTVWSDGRESFFHSIWLRDNCYCGQCGDATIGRRTTRLSDIALTISADSVCIDDTGSLSIKWSDGHKSCFANGWLQTHAYDDKSRRSRSFSSLLWTDEFRKLPVRALYSDVLNDDVAFLEMLRDIREHGICFLDDVPQNPDALEQLACRIGPPQESNFGRIQDLIVDRSKKSIANDVAALKPHTDEPYRASPPGLLMFHCLETDITGGGGSIFLDGFEIAEADLRLRGPGELLGTAQSGISGLKLGDLVTEPGLVQKARDLARHVINEDAALEKPEHQHLKLLVSDDEDGRGVLA